MRPVRTALRGALALAIVAMTSPHAGAATPLTALRYASDTTVDLTGRTLIPADVGEDDLAGSVIPVDVGDIPQDAHIDAYLLLPNGDQLLSFDTTELLPGGITAGPADVVRFNGSTYAIEFNAAAAGVPEGVNVDAISVYASDLLLSFDTTVTLSGNTFEDEDIVRWEPQVPAFAIYLRGVTARMPPELDLDGLQVIDAVHLLASFDGSGSIGGTDFNDDDVLEYDFQADTWEVVYRGAAHHPAWESADLVALFGIVAATPTATVTPIPSPTATGPAPATATGIGTPTATGAESTPTATSPSPPATFTTTTGPTATSTVIAGTPPTATQTAESTPPTATATSTVTAGACLGDCGGDLQVTINELITMVSIALDLQPIARCRAGDGDNDGRIVINELIGAVNNALSGC